jgi:hypothetical protein
VEEATTPARTRQKRPLSVTLVALLALGVALYNLAHGAALTVDGGDERELLEGIFHIAFGLGTLAAGIGAFLLRGWAWVAFMTWAVIGLTLQIVRHLFFDAPNYAAMAINAFAVLALSPLEVQIAFGLRHTQDVELARPTRNPLDRD